MNGLRTVVVALGLVAVLIWAVMATQSAPAPAPPLAVAKRVQCPPGSDLLGKLCVCPKGSSVVDGKCGPGAPQRDTRHVTTVDLRGR